MTPSDPTVPGSAPPDPAPTDAATDPSAAGPPGRRGVLVAGGVAASALLLTAGLTAPRPRPLGDPQGDEAVTSALAPLLAGHSRVGVAVLDPGSDAPRLAGFGDDADGEFEIGSVSKTMTGALLALAVEAGEVTTGTTVAGILGERADGSAIADVTLAELATHTAGLPSVPPGRGLRSVAASFLRRDPYLGQDTDALVEDALGVTPENRGESSYSNLGVALLGALLATSADTPYPDLLRERLLDPLGLGATYAPVLPSDLDDGAPRGHVVSGLGAAPWTMDGAGPAGCIRSTPSDMATYLLGMRDGTAPGAAAATEILVEESDTESVAMTWFHTTLEDGGTMIWHNGRTGGFAAFAGWREDTGLGVVLLTDTARSLDDVALAVLSGEVTL